MNADHYRMTGKSLSLYTCDEIDQKQEISFTWHSNQHSMIYYLHWVDAGRKYHACSLHKYNTFPTSLGHRFPTHYITSGPTLKTWGWLVTLYRYSANFAGQNFHKFCTSYAICEIVPTHFLTPVVWRVSTVNSWNDFSEIFPKQLLANI